MASVPVTVLLVLLLIAVVRRVFVSGAAALVVLAISVAIFTGPLVTANAVGVYRDGPIGARVCV